LANPTTYKSFPSKEPFHEWCEVNAAALLSDPEFGPEIKRGTPFFIITETYSTNRCTVAQWQGQTSLLSIGVSEEAWNGVELTGSGFWGKMSSSGDWRGFGFNEADQKASLSVFYTLRHGESSLMIG
jgi:hypothetical protein